ncbi:MAG: 4-hydroxy-3-methylbut-2-enyl diphosphate reductase [Chitinophagaceae bacterium]|nr:4-hydroxy-3-methylbut-2-enyl diphosphate reductase [Chitinophagaceae bacterium]
MKEFKVPIIYRSPLIAAIKRKRQEQDKMKKDFTPTLLDLGGLQIYLARHFGFCYGVKNAIEIAYRTIDENPGKRIFLLSEMIHNPHVNEDLQERGVRFLQDTRGKEILPFEMLTPDDIVITPAFGTTIQMEKRLQDIGLETKRFNTTCPFVEKVWNRAEQIARRGYSVIIHGRPEHEETRATFSHSIANTASVIIKNMEEAVELGKYITGEKPAEEFYREFRSRFSDGFNPADHLQRIGVVNQTTMLATETQAIADHLKQVMIGHYGLTETNLADRFADTRDTLCYATNDNQTAVNGMLDTDAHIAIVIGGYNSSNTSHLVALCEEKLPTYFIKDESKLLSAEQVLHYDLHSKQEVLTTDYLPHANPARILITSGASCPDALVEEVVRKVASLYQAEPKIEALIDEWTRNPGNKP